MVIGRKARRLDDEDILAADVFLDLDKDFLIGEAAHGALCRPDIQIIGNGMRQALVGIARNDFHATIFMACAPATREKPGAGRACKAAL